jgi:23S rRNA (cytidine1920-2'-O)/16S rRNA (cytidine1409-2'-O)-methyltransferase
MENTTILEHKKRLDVEMLSRGLVRSRSLAQGLIKDGVVTVNGIVATKTNTEVSTSDVIAITRATRFVSRAGEKLAGALSTWKIDVTGKTVLDIGSSTGGFADCLLQNNAAKVIAVDVGTKQMEANLAADARIELHEGTDIRRFKIDSPADLTVIDVSFISLTLVLPKAYELTKAGASVIALIKPQFEVGREIAHKRKGVIQDPAERTVAVTRVRESAETVGFHIVDMIDSPIEGEHGNVEFLLLLKK